MLRDVRLFTCDNGLTLLVWERRDAPLVAMRMGVGTGSAVEGIYGGSGISHLTEHMVFKGTAEMNATQLSEYVAARGGVWNACTGTRDTVFQIDGPACHWQDFMHCLVQITLHPVFPEEEWEKERDVIRREMDMYADDPEEALQRALMETLFCVYPVRFPVIGLRGLFDGLTREDLLNYHAERYVPGNMFLCIVGDVDAEAVFAAMQQEMRPIRPRACVLPACLPEPLRRGSRLCRREFAQSVSSLCLAWNIPSRDHPDMPALSLLAAILGSGRSALLQHEFHDVRALAHDTASYLIPSLSGQGAFVIRADAERKLRDGLRDALLRYVSELPDKELQADMERVRKRYSVGRLKDLSTITSAAETLTATWSASRCVTAYDEWGEALERVSADDLRRVAREYLTPHSIIEVSVDPIGSNKPAARHNRPAKRSAARTHTLANGLRCVVQRDASCPLVYMALAVGAGCRAESASTSGASALIAELLPQGTTTKSSSQIAAAVEGVGASLHSSSGNNSIVLSLRCLPNDAPQMLQLLADVALRPALESRDVATARADMLACLREDMQSPVCVARRELRKLCFGPVSYGLSPTGSEESVQRLDSAALKREHARLFCGGNCVLSLVGCVDESSIVQAVSNAFACMPSGQVAPLSTTPPMRSRRKKCTLREPVCQAAYALAISGLPLRHKDQALLTLLDEWCSDMSGPLYSELREKRGLVYHVGTSLLQGVDAGCIFFELETAPELLATARSAMQRTLASLASRTISRDELQRAKATAISAGLIALQSPARRAVGIALDVLLGLGADYAEKSVKELGDVSLRRMRRFIRDLLAPGRSRSSVHVASR